MKALGNQHAAFDASDCDRRGSSAQIERRVQVDGKLFRQNGDRFYVKGFSYGPFAPNSTGEPLPEREAARADLAMMQSLGANTLRLYSEPSPQVLDDLLEFGIHAIVDIPWEKHRCFFEDWSAREAARESVARAATSIGEHPALLAISVVNEIPNDVVRFYGHARIEKFLTELSDSVKQLCPDCLTTFANYPTTEFLQPEGFDFCCFNVYLHDAGRLGAYLDRLQHIAGDLPLVLSEFGLDSIREGERVQAELLAAHIRTVFQHGVAGSVIFSFTDEWFTGGRLLDQWGFGVTRADRSLKSSADAVRQAWQQAPFSQNGKLPKVSVVVCAYNAARTLPECLRSLGQIDYPDYEVILVDDGSKDNTPAIAAEFPQIVYIRQANRGLSVARNVGAEQSDGRDRRVYRRRLRGRRRLAPLFGAGDGEPAGRCDRRSEHHPAQRWVERPVRGGKPGQSEPCHAGRLPGGAHSRVQYGLPPRCADAPRGLRSAVSPGGRRRRHVLAADR